jgi:hypothetical protein
MPQIDHNLPEIGYLFHYPSLDHPTDKFRLDIYISNTPTEKHFDVLHVILNVESEYGGLERLKITHPWEYQNTHRLCPGMIILEDRYGKKEEAFCFGGQLTIHKKSSLTECYLVSPAPILELEGNNPMRALLIERAEIGLAKYRAVVGNDQEYEVVLCAADPLDLYLAFLYRSIDEARSKAPKDDLDLQYLSYLRKEKYRLQTAGIIREPVPSLDDIFTR